MKTDEHIPLDARVHHDGRVDVVIEGEPIEGGQGLPMESVLSLLAGFAKQNGTLLMSTQMPDGRTTRELVTGTGEVLPYYPPGDDVSSAGDGAAQVDPVSSQQFYENLRRRSRSGFTQPSAHEPVPSPAYAAPDEDLFASPPAAAPPARTVATPKFGARPGFKEQNQKLTADDVPEYDVEGDVQKAMSGRKSKGKRGPLALLAVIAIVLVVLVVAGMMLFSGAGPLTGAAPVAPPVVGALPLVPTG